MAANPKSLKHLAGTLVDPKELVTDPPAIPVDPASQNAAVLQLQNTVDALIAKFNAHQHGETVAAATIWDGAVVSAHVSGLAVDVTAGDVRNTDGTFKAIAAVSNLALSTADGTNGRIDLIQVATATGSVTKKNGVAAPSPVAPAADAGNLPLATVLVPASATVPSTITDTRPRPSVETGGVPSSLFDGSPVSPTGLFTNS